MKKAQDDNEFSGSPRRMVRVDAAEYPNRAGQVCGVLCGRGDRTEIPSGVSCLIQQVSHRLLSVSHSVNSGSPQKGNFLIAGRQRVGERDCEGMYSCTRTSCHGRGNKQATGGMGARGTSFRKEDVEGFVRSD